MSVENLEFKTEVNQLLNLVIHSLYSHKEIFLRELISNASDAIDKARYEALTNSDIAEKTGEFRIKIIPNKNDATLTISDNGIGMTKDEAIMELGTIAHSGTMEFLKLLKSREVKDNPELIGQFGVGFYSSFMVSDKVIVITRKAGVAGKSAIRWESEAKGTFTVDEVEKETPGTDVILHLKSDDKKYLEEWEIRQLIRKYSDYIDHPIVMDVEHEKESTVDKGKKYKEVTEETLNSRKAIWLKDKSDITSGEYNEFYKHLSHDFKDPARIVHYKAEGTNEFSALLYIPSISPFDIFYQDFKTGPSLYVRRVQIMDHCEELLPRYLRFIKGVIDSSDLPLNVSREILQNNRQVEVINKSITKKILDTLADMKTSDFDAYVSFYKELGKVLKEGVHFDFARRETILDLLLFESTTTEPDKYTSLNDYVGRMKENQEDIYYIAGASRDEVKMSPYLETFRDKGYEVLFMLDEIDDLIFAQVTYKGKPMKSVIRGDVSLDDTNKEEKAKKGEEYKQLFDLVRDRLKDDVKEVRFSGRLTDSPCCLVADDNALDPHMERMLKSMGKDMPSAKRILEVNPTHPLIESMYALYNENATSKKLNDYIDLLYGQALLLEGGKPKDPAAFSRTVTGLMLEGAKR
ncbi:MAG: molecular chaperone HtpG [Nitrospirae bacterium]|nr:molecular chaperone HtpG [Nitrospirota bacterium]